MDSLKADNKRLEDKIGQLGQEMSFLKDIFLAHSGTGGQPGQAGQAGLAGPAQASALAQASQEVSTMLYCNWTCYCTLCRLQREGSPLMTAVWTCWTACCGRLTRRHQPQTEPHHDHQPASLFTNFLSLTNKEFLLVLSVQFFIIL